MNMFGHQVYTYNTVFDNGDQYLFRFDNDLGASVVKHDYSYGGQLGLWEVALIQWGDGEDGYELTYNDYFSDVRGWQNDNDVEACLKLISSFTE